MVINDISEVELSSTQFSGDDRNFATHFLILRGVTDLQLTSELVLHRKGNTSYKKHCPVLHPSLNSRCLVEPKLRSKVTKSCLTYSRA